MSLIILNKLLNKYSIIKKKKEHYQWIFLIWLTNLDHKETNQYLFLMKKYIMMHYKTHLKITSLNKKKISKKFIKNINLEKFIMNQVFHSINNNKNNN